MLRGIIREEVAGRAIPIGCIRLSITSGNRVMKTDQNEHSDGLYRKRQLEDGLTFKLPHLLTIKSQMDV